MKRYIFIFLVFMAFALNAQDSSYIDNSNYNLDIRKRNVLLISEASAYTISLVLLNQLWYSEYPRSRFHFINDNLEWMQMDKLGHMSTSYYSGVVGIEAYKWTGMSKKNAIWYGGLTGSFFLTIIEVLDGFSRQWGASFGDLLANSAGSFLAIGQALRWDEQRIQLKYSYFPSEWAEYNPSQLGSGNIERALKDYNGQTYWLSFNIKSLFNISSPDFPSYLSLSLGYSADKMTSPFSENSNPERQYLLSADIDLNKIKTKNKIINSILHTFGFLKFPMPAFEYRNNKLYFHTIYY